MKFIAFLLSLVLLTSIVIPNGIVAQEANQTSGVGEESVGVTDQITVAVNQTGTNGTTTESIPLEDKVAVSETMNPESEELSSFVYGAILLFKQQREETINAIKECRENIQNASSENRQQAREDCKASLNEIKEFYKEMRDQIRELFKEQRENVKILIKEAKTSIAENKMVMQEESDEDNEE